MYFKVAPKGWIDSAFFVDLPFLHQMGYTALLTMLIIIVVSQLHLKGQNDEKGITISNSTFKTSTVFNVGAFALMICLAALYALFWK